jgi:hypothetical protein
MQEYSQGFSTAPIGALPRFSQKEAQIFTQVIKTLHIAGVVFVISAFHTLYINITFVPKEIQPLPRRCALLILKGLGYGFFVYLWLMGGLIPDSSKGFLFTMFGNKS